MIILTLRTDKPQAEIGLYEDEKQLAYYKWQAHRQLAETIHKKLLQLLNKPAPHQNLSGVVGNRITERQVFGAGSSKEWGDIEGIVVFKGPGSFTGLRIGLTVANALVYSYKIPIVARGGSRWIETGIKNLLAGQNDKIALPEYGAPANITKPRK